MGKPRDLANVVATGNILADGAVAPAELTGVTSTAAEINILDGVTATATELNLMDGVTATTAELNYVDGVTSNVQTQIDTKAPVAGPTFTGTLAAPTINASTALQIGGVAITATAAELNIMDGVTASASDLNGVAGINSNVQTQLNLKAPIDGATFTGTTTIPTADINGGAIDGAIIGANSAAAVTATTLNASTKLQVNGTDVITNARALSNITSIDATTAAAIGAGGVGGGGSADFVATGSITAGNLVGLTSTGTVKVVPALLGDPNEFKDEGKNEVFGVYEPNSGSVLVTFQGTSNRGFCKVGTVSGNTISFGSEVQFSGNFTTNIHDVFIDTTNNNVIIMYQDESNSDRGYIVSGTLSGQSVTFGSELNWTGVTSSAGIYTMGGAWDASAQRIVAVYRQGSDSNKAKIAVISAGSTGNRTLTTQGTPAAIGSNTYPDSINVTYDSTAQKTIAMFTDGNLNKRVFVAMTVGSTSVTQGTLVQEDSNATAAENFKSAFIPGTNKVAYVYKQTTGPDMVVVGLITLSGTTITKNETTMARDYASIAQYANFSMIGTANGKFMVFFADNDQNAPDKYRCTYGKFSGTTAVFEKNDFFFSNDANKDTGNEIGHVSYASGLGKFLLAHRANNSSTGVETCQALFGAADDMEVFENTVGLATQSVSNGATVTVTIVGGINENQSNLTIGRKYFLGQGGTLTNIQPEGFFPSDRIVGIATATTKLLVTNSATTISMDGESALIGET